MKQINVSLAAAAFGGSMALLGIINLSAPAGAQEPQSAYQAQPYIDYNCGSWQDDTWVPNGNCPPDNDRLRHARVSGTITTVSGHLVTIQETGGTLVINDQPALDRQLTGRVAVGRQVVAHGYWLAGTFYATRLV